MQRDKEGDAEAWALWLELNKVENRPQLCEELQKHMKNVPMDARYRRWPVVDTAQWKKSFGKRNSQLTDHARKPFTKAAFLCWCQNRQGLTDTQASRWWAQFYNDPSILRDNSGYEGAEVLYICKGKVLNNRSEVYVDGHCETASKVIKAPTDKDVSALQNFSHEAVDSFNSDFFQNAGAIQHNPSAAGEDAKKLSGKKDWDTAKLANEVPKLHASITKAVLLLAQDATKVLRKSETIMVGVRDYGCELAMADRALTSMIENLVFRSHLLLRWEGSHPSASIKFVFEAAKVELAPGSPPKKARCALSDPYAGIASKSEASSPSASSPITSMSDNDHPPRSFDSLESRIDREEEEKMAVSRDVAHRELATVLTADAAEGIVDAITDKDIADALTGARKWFEFMRPWQSINPHLKFKQVVEKYPRMKPFKNNVDEFMDRKQMDEMLAEMFTTIDTVEAYDLMNDKWNNAKSIHSQMTNKLNTQCGDIKGYISNINRRDTRAKEKAGKDRQVQVAAQAANVA